MNKLKQVQIDFIVDEAAKLFCHRSIGEVTISDIANELEIGEASLYRYFGKKANLVLLCAEKLSKEVLETNFQVDESVNGFTRIKDFFESYLNVFIYNKRYFRFVNSLDSYLATEKELDLSNYATIINSYKKIFDNAFELGIKDGSISYEGDKDIFYRATSLSLMNLCKKLAVEDDLLEEDKMYDSTNEIKALIEVFLYRIQSK